MMRQPQPCGTLDGGTGPAFPRFSGRPLQDAKRQRAFPRLPVWALACCLSLLFQAGASLADTIIREVLDGDTLLLQDGRTIRYLGVNAPEKATEMKHDQPFARKAAEWNRNMVLGKSVRMEMDSEEQDTFGRTLAYVYLPNGTMVNQAILAEGLAQYFPYRQSMKHAKVLLDAQRSAMQARKGLWKNWQEKPGIYLANRRSLRFHVPGCPFGRKTSSRNRVVFHRMWDAYWEGYFPCKQCLPERGLSPKP